MGKRLKQVVEQYITIHGNEGKARLMAAVNRSERTITNWMATGVPKANDAFKLAVACGLDEAEALRLAKEESASRAKRTA